MKNWLKAILAIALFTLLGVLLARGCGGVNQYAQLGEALGQRAQTGGTTAQGFAYVGDIRRSLYWPNEPQYVDAIPEADRVWIKDAETLRQFKGYKPGKR